MGKDPVVLDVRSLDVCFHTPGGPVQALRDISFRVKRGEVFAIAGESGAGKSVLCHSLVGRIEASASVSGTIRFDGRPMLGLGKAALRKLYARDIAVLPQHATALNPLLTIGQHLAETLRAHFPELKRREVRDRSMSLLETFGFRDPARIFRCHPYQLSGGMKQRALIALAYCCDPVLVIADEPTKALDPVLKDELVETLLEITAGRNASMVLVTHDLKVAHRLADTIGILYRGRFMERGGCRQVLEKSIHPYTAMLIRAMPENGLAPDAEGDALAEGPAGNGGCPFQGRCRRGRREMFHPYEAVNINDNHTIWCRYADSPTSFEGL
jgi:ABC-type glutathione transport system ATPase component